MVGTTVTAEQIATALRTARIKAGLTQEQAAEAAGMAQQHWARLEAGGRPVRSDVLARAAEAVGLRLELRRARRQASAR